MILYRFQQGTLSRWSYIRCSSPGLNLTVDGSLRRTSRKNLHPDAAVLLLWHYCLVACVHRVSRCPLDTSAINMFINMCVLAPVVQRRTLREIQISLTLTHAGMVDGWWWCCCYSGSGRHIYACLCYYLQKRFINVDVRTRSDHAFVGLLLARFRQRIHSQAMVT